MEMGREERLSKEGREKKREGEKKKCMARMGSWKRRTRGNEEGKNEMAGGYWSE